ncbi:MAG: serine/threonine protein kinase [Planctomycetaceae bacterium]|nr:serine/threonine protein kinase [Planctomycetaceae bacterium]
MIPGFQIERELGRGGNGTVFLARSTNVDRLVALKFLRSGLTELEDDASPRISEGQAVSKLRHSNIVQLHDVLHVSPWTVLVLEYVPGGSLKDRLSGPMIPVEAARILEIVTRTIAFVHRNGLLHLDIKPSNILVDGDPAGPLEAGQIKITDFGVSLPWGKSPINSQSALRGTPSYMAPEQAGSTGYPIGPATDVYGLGALLYSLLCGRPPRASDSAEESLTQTESDAPISPRELNPAIPRDLEAICLHCLERRPDDRYASANDLAEDLRRFLDGRRISIRPVSIGQLSRWCRQRPAIATLVLSLLCTILLSIGGLSYALHEAQVERAFAVEARVRAEQNEAIASRTLEDLDAWIQQTLADPSLLNPIAFPALADDVRSLSLEHRTDEPTVLRMAATLSMLELLLATNLRFKGISAGGPDEAAVVLDRSRQHLDDCLQWKPDAEVLREQYALTLLESAVTATHQERSDDVEKFCADAVSLVSTISDRELRIRILCQVSHLLRETAFTSKVAGLEDVATRVIRSNLEMLKQISPEDLATPDVQLQRAISLSWLGRDEEAIPILRDLNVLPPSDWVRFDETRTPICQWVAKPVVELILWTRSPAGVSIDLDQEASILIDCINDRSTAIGLGESAMPRIGNMIFDAVYRGSAAERTQRRVESENGTADRFLAFAKGFAEAYPNSLDSYVMLSRAHQLMAKTGWYFEDVAAAHRELQLALNVAHRAKSKYPESPAVLELVVDIERRLADAEAVLNSAE